jgi:hypothetical protein
MVIVNAGYLIFITAMAVGFAWAEDIRHELMEDGFENVSMVLEDGRLIVTYENRVYRYEMRALREVMAALLPLLKEGVSLTLIPQSRGVPLFAITVPGCEYLADGWKNPPNPLYKGEEGKRGKGEGKRGKGKGNREKGKGSRGDGFGVGVGGGDSEWSILGRGAGVWYRRVF